MIREPVTKDADILLQSIDADGMLQGALSRPIERTSEHNVAKESGLRWKGGTSDRCHQQSAEGWMQERI